MRTNALDLFHEDVIEFIVSTIGNNDGQEVSFVGNVDRDGKVCEVDVIAYGNENGAPIVFMEVLQGDVLIHNHPPEDLAEVNEFDPEILRASEADIEIASQLANKKIGFYIIDNLCRFVNVIYQPAPRVYLNEGELTDVFDIGGLLSKTIQPFEPRAEQIDLVKSIVESINESRIFISEAGTGTGKSLAYLIPVSIWATQNKKRVIVTTHTINLQQQILNKDMQMVKKVVKEYIQKDLHYSLLIGKGNYICKKKLEEFIRDREKQVSLFGEEEDYSIIFEIEEWARNCTEGTRTEFGQLVKNDIWEEVACDSIVCARKKCVFYTDCFYYRARLEAEKSNVIIVNHSLVFSTIDESSHRSSLPFFSGIVFDEAHHIEDVALKALSKEFSIQSLLYHLHKIHTQRGNKTLGILFFLSRELNFKGFIELDTQYQKIVKLLNDLKKVLNDFIPDSLEVLRKWMKESSSVGLNEDFIDSPDFHYILDYLNRIFQKIRLLSSTFEDFANTIRGVSSSKKVADILVSITYRIQSLMESEQIFQLIFNRENDISFVKWIEVTKKNLRFYYSPLELGDFLSNSLFSKKDFTVFTSATLQINQKFDYFENSVGIALTGNKDKERLALTSPFDYSKQMEIYILENAIDHGNLAPEKIDMVRELALISEGGVLVLFTSYVRLTAMYESLKDTLTENGIIPLKQGDASREELLKKMVSFSNVVLFATSSFWEGIDIQGDNLRCVIIEKLPFDSPGDPVYKAKVKLLESKGANPFISYSIPRAVLRLKQGVGRLVRSKTDKGVIAIMDHRIKAQRYGSIFFNSLPKTKIITGSLSSIVAEAEDFFIKWFVTK